MEKLRLLLKQGSEDDRKTPSRGKMPGGFSGKTAAVAAKGVRRHRESGRLFEGVFRLCGSGCLDLDCQERGCAIYFPAFPSCFATFSACCAQNYHSSHRNPILLWKSAFHFMFSNLYFFMKKRSLHLKPNQKENSMAKITFMGAGSTVFAKNVLGDCMCRESLKDSHIALYDISRERLVESEKMLTTLNRNINGGRAKITTHLGVANRKKARHRRHFPRSPHHSGDDGFCP